MRNIPKKIRRKKQYREDSASQWVREFEGENIVEAYSKWYRVGLLCAIKELRDKGIKIEKEYERKVQQEVKAKKRARRKNKQNRKRNKKAKQQDQYSDDRFAFIVGYTSGGAAFGVTHEEMQEGELEQISLDLWSE